MARPVLSKITTAKETAAAGVDYSPRAGATCPWCGERAKIYKTLPWECGTRIRYHRCQNIKCVLFRFSATIKSIEADIVKEVSP